MEITLSLLAGIGGIILAGLAVAFLAGWLLLRRSARKLKQTT